MTPDVSINGLWLSSIGVTLVDRVIPPLPEAKEYTIELADRDGDISFGSSYGPRVINLGLFILGDYHRTVARIAQVFNAKLGVLDLVFSDVPSKHYKVRYSGTISLDAASVNRQVDIPLKMNDPFPVSDERVLETTITRTPQVVSVESQGDVRSKPLIVLTNIGTTTLQSFKIRNEYLMEG
ncbi:phage tail domain-containing protein [Paenibacillus glucanolyticus]|uniref:phage tail domain-containing protein n=1 Tax=Paenibacillus glucanolyticus TaxID=59843 RepID=UPI0035DA07E1